MSIKSDLKTISLYYEMSVEEYKRDKCKARLHFMCVIDDLCKSGDISEKTYQNVDVSLNKRNELVLRCLSYSMKLRNF